VLRPPTRSTAPVPRHAGTWGCPRPEPRQRSTWNTTLARPTAVISDRAHPNLLWNARARRVLVTSPPGRDRLGPLALWPAPCAAQVPKVLGDRCRGVRDGRRARRRVDPAGLDIARRRAVVADRSRGSWRSTRQCRGYLSAVLRNSGRAGLGCPRPTPGRILPPQPRRRRHGRARDRAPCSRARHPARGRRVQRAPPAHALPAITAELSRWWANLGLDASAHAGSDGDRSLAVPRRAPGRPAELVEPRRAWSRRPGWRRSGPADHHVHVTFATELPTPTPTRRGPHCSRPSAITRPSAPATTSRRNGRTAYDRRAVHTSTRAFGSTGSPHGARASEDTNPPADDGAGELSRGRDIVTRPTW
jgi:hypothetical protein